MSGIRALPLKYPLARQLVASKIKYTKRTGGRINIVNPSLCDDVLNQLAPSLAPNQKCDIVDLNPGVGLWSSKLHDLLNPRTHILLEPEERYVPFLRPLLDQPHSTYRLFPHKGEEWSTWDKIIQEGLLPHQKIPKEGDPGFNELNHSLLFVANLSASSKLGPRDSRSIAQQVLHQFLSSIRTHSACQAYGLVRMLIWVTDPEKKNAVPRTIADRKKFAVHTEMSCKHVQEVAGVDGSGSKNRRQTGLDITGCQRVLKLAKDNNNPPIPEPRKGEMQRTVETDFSYRLADFDLASTSSRSAWHGELEKLEEEFKNKQFARFIGQDPRDDLDENAPNRRRGVNRLLTPEYQRLLVLRNFDKGLRRKLAGVNKLFSYDQVLAEEEVAAADIPDPEERSKALTTISAKRNEAIDRFSEKVQCKFFLLADDEHAFHGLEPPILMWDRRTQEPLIVQLDDFHPQTQLALLDITPKPSTTPPNVHEAFEYIAQTLFLHSTQSVEQGLETLAPGAKDYIIPRCPSLRDPKKGGRKDINQMRIRMLTPEMFLEIAEAWETWPFKLTKADFLSRGYRLEPGERKRDRGMSAMM